MDVTGGRGPRGSGGPAVPAGFQRLAQGRSPAAQRAAAGPLGLPTATTGHRTELLPRPPGTSANGLSEPDLPAGRAPRPRTTRPRAPRPRAPQPRGPLRGPPRAGALSRHSTQSAGAQWAPTRALAMSRAARIPNTAAGPIVEPGPG